MTAQIRSDTRVVDPYVVLDLLDRLLKRAEEQKWLTEADLKLKHKGRLERVALVLGKRKLHPDELGQPAKGMLVGLHNGGLSTYEHRMEALTGTFRPMWKHVDILSWAAVGMTYDDWVGKKQVTSAEGVTDLVRSPATAPTPLEAHQLSATGYFLGRLERLEGLIRAMANDSVRDVQAIIRKVFNKRAHLSVVLADHFMGVLDGARGRKNSPRKALLDSIVQYRAGIHKAQEAVATSAAMLLERFNQGGSSMVGAIVVMDFSMPVAKAMQKLAAETGSSDMVRLHVVYAKTEHFGEHDVETWKKQFSQNSFYRFEEVTNYADATALFVRLRKEKVATVLLLGAERLFPDGSIGVYPAVDGLVSIAKSHQVPSLVIAESYKVHSSSSTEGFRTVMGSGPKGEMLVSRAIENRLSLLTDHGHHEWKKTPSETRIPRLQCCQRHWANKLSGRDHPVAVLFDLDGTVLDNEDQHRQLYKEVAEMIGYDLTDEEYNSIARGRTDEETIALFYKRGKRGHSLSLNDLIRHKQERYLQLIRSGEVSLRQGAEQYIRSLHSQGFLLGLATGATPDEAEASLAIHNLKECFEVVLAAGSTKKGKPDPSIYRKAAEGLGVRPNECLVYEDSIAGINAAVAASMRVVAVAPGAPKDQVLKAGAFRIIADFVKHDLPELPTAATG